MATQPQNAPPRWVMGLRVALFAALLLQAGGLGGCDGSEAHRDVPDAPTDGEDLADEEADPRDADASDTEAVDDGDAEVDSDPEQPAWLASLASEADWERMAGASEELKYLAKLAPAGAPEALPAPCTFQNMAEYAWHLPFLLSLAGFEGLTLSDYTAMVLVRGSRILWGGGIYSRPEATHPISAAVGIYVYTVYGEDRPNSITPDDVVAAHAALGACAPGLASRLVFVASGSAQQQLVVEHGAALQALGVPTLLR